MSSLAEVIVEEPFEPPEAEETKKFTRLERMLLFAVVSECERCISAEGEDCISATRKVDCPFFKIRQEYGISDISEWKGRVG